MSGRNIFIIHSLKIAIYTNQLLSSKRWGVQWETTTGTVSNRTNIMFSIKWERLILIPSTTMYKYASSTRMSLINLLKPFCYMVCVSTMTTCLTPCEPLPKLVWLSYKPSIKLVYKTSMTSNSLWSLPLLLPASICNRHKAQRGRGLRQLGQLVDYSDTPFLN